MSERLLWQKFRAALGGKAHLQRIESFTAAGIPDVEYCCDGESGWIELKYGKIPAKGGTAVFKSQRGLTPEQIEWLLCRRCNGGRAWVLVDIGGALFLVDGLKAPSFNTWTMHEFAHNAVWLHIDAMGVREWDELLAVLCA